MVVQLCQCNGCRRRRVRFIEGARGGRIRICTVDIAICVLVRCRNPQSSASCIKLDHPPGCFLDGAELFACGLRCAR